VLVVTNGAPRTVYDDVRARFPHVEWVHDDPALGFAGAIERGLALARYDGTYLVNNDMTIEPDALAQVLALLPIAVAGALAIGLSAVERQRLIDAVRERLGAAKRLFGRRGLEP
jgi:GT2 family glycosyltransferase